MQTQKIFLASSSELKEDRKEFESFVNRKNKEWVDKGVFLKLIVWEDFLDALAPTRLQDEYNKEIRRCDLFVMLFFTKVGKYTAEEFETAFGQFQATRKPFIFTYFKDAPINTGSIDEDDLMSLLAFKKKLKTLGHFVTVYQNIDALKLHFNQQLDKLVASGFIEFEPDRGATPSPGGNTYQATLTGNGAIAQGRDATAAGAGGVAIGGNHTGNINTGTQTWIPGAVPTSAATSTRVAEHLSDATTNWGVPMNDDMSSPPKDPPRGGKKAKVRGSGAVAQGKRAKAAGRRGVAAETVTGNIATGDTYQFIMNQAAQSGASAGDLRRAYLAWLSVRVNDLPLLAGDSGKPVQLSSVYTALLTQGRDASEAHLRAASSAARVLADRAAARQSALEALDQERYLVLLGGPRTRHDAHLSM